MVSELAVDGGGMASICGRPLHLQDSVVKRRLGTFSSGDLIHSQAAVRDRISQLTMSLMGYIYLSNCCLLPNYSLSSR